MEQLVEYSDIKTITDITKKFASIPCEVVQKGDEAPQFTIANYDEFKDVITRLTCQIKSENIVVNKMNVAAYESDASAINKLIKQVKTDAQKYVDLFTLKLLGKGGRNPVIGQVQEIQQILQDAYDTIHAKTVEYRDKLKIEKSSDNVIEVEAKESTPTYAYTVTCTSEQKDLFEQFCLKNHINFLQQ